MAKSKPAQSKFMDFTNTPLTYPGKPSLLTLSSCILVLIGLDAAAACFIYKYPVLILAVFWISVITFAVICGTLASVSHWKKVKLACKILNIDEVVVSGGISKKDYNRLTAACDVGDGPGKEEQTRLMDETLEPYIRVHTLVRKNPKKLLKSVEAREKAACEYEAEVEVAKKSLELAAKAVEKCSIRHAALSAILRERRVPEVIGTEIPVYTGGVDLKDETIKYLA